MPQRVDTDESRYQEYPKTQNPRGIGICSQTQEQIPMPRGVGSGERRVLGWGGRDAVCAISPDACDLCFLTIGE